LLRFLLALALAGGYIAGMFGFPRIGFYLGTARAGQIFYLISGFLMAMILNGKYADTPHGNWLFYTNRAVKIFAPCHAIPPQTDRADSGHFVCLYGRACSCHSNAV
jgi:peptidoglycan/LPS O-acetylase OafA/YrhL